MTASARVAGYEGTSLKQTAQAVDRSSKVTALIARAKQEMERRGAPAVYMDPHGFQGFTEGRRLRGGSGPFATG
jgi:phage terminase small subunit